MNRHDERADANRRRRNSSFPGRTETDAQASSSDPTTQLTFPSLNDPPPPESQASPYFHQQPPSLVFQHVHGPQYSPGTSPPFQYQSYAPAFIHIPSQSGFQAHQQPLSSPGYFSSRPTFQRSFSDVPPSSSFRAGPSSSSIPLSTPPTPMLEQPLSAESRSDWAMWVGNVPKDATQEELFRFFSQSPTSGSSTVPNNGVLSIFLILRSHCAFVNYVSEEDMMAAIKRFNGLSLRQEGRSAALLCRKRDGRNDFSESGTGQQKMKLHRRWVKQRTQSHSSEDESDASTTSSFLQLHFPRRFFILKSLTQDDLDLSVRHGLWATQKHNQSILEQAFRTSEHVFLIFSVNKSGEFFGYARMASLPAPGSVQVDWTHRQTSPTSPGAREGGNEWGHEFHIHWIRTKRLPFAQTRNFRNPWNQGREIKVSRDGTELESSVGEAVLAAWDKPALSNN